MTALKHDVELPEHDNGHSLTLQRVIDNPTWTAWHNSRAGTAVFQLAC